MFLVFTRRSSDWLFSLIVDTVFKSVHIPFSKSNWVSSTDLSSSRIRSIFFLLRVPLETITEESWTWKKLSAHKTLSQVCLLLNSVELFRELCCRPLSIVRFFGMLMCLLWKILSEMQEILFHSPWCHSNFVKRIYADDSVTYFYNFLFWDYCSLIIKNLFLPPLTLLELSLASGKIGSSW